MKAARSGAAGGAFDMNGYAAVAGGSNLSNSELFGFATVKTDKDDYAPGEVVVVTGTGWNPAAPPTLTFHQLDSTETYTFTKDEGVTVDAAGNLYFAVWAPQLDDVGMTFDLTAADAASQAMTRFTDSVTSVAITPQQRRAP